MNNSPLELLHSPTSPYVRKVLLVVHEGGIASQVSLKSVSPWDEGNPVLKITPTGTLPALLIHDDPHITLISESSAICAYLVERFCLTHLVPIADKHRIWQQVAVADKIMFTVMHRFLELNKRGETERSEYFLARWQHTLETSVAYLEHASSTITTQCTLASLAVATALSYISLRHDDYNWQQAAPQLADWHSQFKQRASMQITEPPQK